MRITIVLPVWPSVTIARGLAALLAISAAFLIAPTASAATPGDLPGSSSAEQVIVVSSTNFHSTHARLSAYEKSAAGTWVAIETDVPAFVGAHGIVSGAQRRQGTNTTPAGTYAITSAFGRRANPGTTLPYVQVDANDAWTYNPRVPSTYNLFQSAPVNWASYGRYVEHLWKLGRQYDYVAVLDYNFPGGNISADFRGVRHASIPADTRAGGGIFLHVSKGVPTAGCISINEPAMRHVMDWLDISKHPVIVIGHADELALD
jgi:L,D-peptidoglycan transpeptidase YkuD (ErfK/YbiS/YcfS/YnhG family)